jgi:hypothetical protein
MDIVCELFDSKRKVVVSELAHSGIFERMFDYLLSNSETTLTERIINIVHAKSFDKRFRTFITQSPSFGFAMSFTSTVYEHFHEKVLQICLNCITSFKDHEVENFIMPILIKNTNNNNRQHVFRSIVKLFQLKKISDRFIKDDFLKHFFESCSNENIEDAMMIIHDCMNSNKSVCEKLAIGLWESPFRKKILLSFHEKENFNVKTQNVLLTIFNHAICIDGFEYNLDEEEENVLQICIWNKDTTYFSIFSIGLFKFRVSTDVILEMCRIFQLDNYLNTTARSYIYNIFFDALLFHKYPLAEIKMLDAMGENKHFFKPLDVDSIKDIDQLESLKKLYIDIKVQDSFVSQLSSRQQELKKQYETNEKLKKIGIEIDTPSDFSCPITLEVMTNPVVASDGHSYEKSALIKLFQSGTRKSPMTREQLRRDVMISNLNLKKRIKEYNSDICDLLVKRAKR